MFGSAVSPFHPGLATNRAYGAWAAAGLDGITFHECRHSYASLMIAAGVGPKHISDYMGHATIAETLDTYGHLIPGSEEEAAGMLDAYYQRKREEAANILRAVEVAGRT